MTVDGLLDTVVHIWWGTLDPRPTLSEAIAHALAAAGYHVVQEGTVPPWMEKVSEVHERAATPEEVDDGCELGVAYDDLYRLRHDVGEGLSE